MDIPKPFSRPARLEDFFDEGDDITNVTNNQKQNHSHNNKNEIPKNQQEYGNRKRIKP